MSEEKVEAKENVAEELTEWSEVDLSPASEQEKIEFEVEGAEPEVEIKPEVEEAPSAPAVDCLLYTSPSPRDVEESRMPSSA